MVNTFTVEDRTRTSQNPQRRHSCLESSDEQFESELPPEIRGEREAPVRIPESEQEIQAAIAWLKSRGYWPSESAPSSSGELSPPVSPTWAGTMTLTTSSRGGRHDGASSFLFFRGTARRYIAVHCGENENLFGQ